MIGGDKYVVIVEDYFSFLITEFGFKIFEEKVRSNVFYDIQYRSKTQVVSISYENMADYLLVIIFLLQNGKMPDYDDKTKTLHLNHLNAIVISTLHREEIDLNNRYFLKFASKNEIERKLLKAAKELRLCLKNSSIW